MTNFHAESERFAVWLDTHGKGRYQRQRDELLGRCPRPDHEDEHPSFRYNVSKDCWICTCGGGKGSDLRCELGYINSPSRPASRPGVAKRTEYALTNERGDLIAKHVRLDKTDGTKSFVWLGPTGETGLNGTPLATLPLYNLPKLLAAPKPSGVIVTEGEKKCEALQEHGFLAVGTTTGASGCPSDESLRPLVGHNVYLWPDNDEPGRLHMEKVGGALHRLWVTVRVIAWSEAREKGDDAADFFKRGGTVEGVRDLLRDAKPWTAATEVPKTECVPSALDASVARLAALPCLEYEKIRKGEAKKLGVRADALDRGVQAARRAAGHGAGNDRKLQGRALALADAEPWPEPVDGAALLHDLAAVFRRFLVLPDGAAEALALWSVFTHTHDTFQVSPRLAITSPEKRCGKTTLLSILGALVPRPLPASNVTAAVVFRAVEAARPTLLVDEVDTFLSNRDELRGILNSGHTRAGAYVVRCVGDDAEPRQFTTWAPVAIACIGRLPDTLADLSRAGLTEPPRVGSY